MYKTWGTKWNSYDDHVEIVTDDEVEYTFSTALGPLNLLLKNLDNVILTYILRRFMTSQEWKLQDITDGFRLLYYERQS